MVEVHRRSRYLPDRDGLGGIFRLEGRRFRIQLPHAQDVFRLRPRSSPLAYPAVPRRLATCHYTFLPPSARLPSLLLPDPLHLLRCRSYRRVGSGLPQTDRLGL